MSGSGQIRGLFWRDQACSTPNVARFSLSREVLPVIRGVIAEAKS